MSDAVRSSTPKGFWTIWSTVALDLVGFGIVVPILALYAQDFGASPFVTGLLLASYSLAQFVAAPVLGRLSDRVGRKPVLIVSLIGTAIGSLVTGLAGSLWVVFAGRLIDGASGGSISVAQAAVTDLAPGHQRERLLGLLGAAFGIGFVIGPAIGGLAALGGTHVPFFVAAGLAAANALAAAIRLPETRRVVRATTPRSLRRPMPGPLTQLAVIGLLTMLAFVAFEATFSLFGERRFDLSEVSTSFVFVGIGAVIALVQGGLYGRVVARLGLAFTLRSGLGALAAGLVALAVAETWVTLALALTAITIGHGFVSPSLMSLVAHHAPEDQRGQMIGTQQSMSALARIVGPLLGTLFLQHVSDGSPFVFAACVTLVGLASAALWNVTPPTAAAAMTASTRSTVGQ